MGVRERQYTANLRQVGQFIPQQNPAAELTGTIHRGLRSLILRKQIPENDRVYLHLSSSRLHSSFD